MTEVAGEVADGFLVHPFSTAEFLREHTFPALDRGLAISGRTREDIEISWPAMVVTGATDEDVAGAASVTRPSSRSTARRPRTGSCSTPTGGATSSRS